MVVLIFLGGVMRMLGQPINWSGDAATGLFAWACFLCADIAWRRNSLMAIEVVTSRLPERLHQAIRMINYALIASFLVYLVVMGLYLSWISRVRSFQGIPAISYSWVTLSATYRRAADAGDDRTQGWRRAAWRGRREPGRGRPVMRTMSPPW